MIGRWVRWKPVDDLSVKYEIESFSLDDDGFVLMLADVQDPKKKVQVHFAQDVTTFRRIKGDLRLVVIENLYQRYGKEFIDDWTFFKATDSYYVRTIMEDSLEIFSSEEFNHVAFITPNSILELTIGCDPSILFVT